MPQPSIYLAGPEVFLPDARAVGAAKKALCARYGFEGRFPLDETLALEGLEPRAEARVIFDACVRMMRACDLCIANCTPFRGVSMDVGTAFEIGFMRALGKPVFGYTTVSWDYATRVTMYRPYRQGVVVDGDRADLDVERFGLADNLMIGIGAALDGVDIICPTDAQARADIADLATFERCLAAVRARYDARGNG